MLFRCRSIHFWLCTSPNAICAGSGAYTYIAISIVYCANYRSAISSDVAVVLGAGIIHDKPSPVFRERINHGVSLYKAGKVKKIIFTGGIGKGETFAESEVAKMYAIKHGVNSNDIFTEKKSTITYENILEAQKILHANKLYKVLLVSDPLHMKRAMTMAQDLGINVNTAPTPTSMYKTWPTKLDFLIREIYFFIGYLLHKEFV